MRGFERGMHALQDAIAAVVELKGWEAVHTFLVVAVVEVLSETFCTLLFGSLGSWLPLLAGLWVLIWQAKWHSRQRRLHEEIEKFRGEP